MEKEQLGAQGERLEPTNAHRPTERDPISRRTDEIGDLEAYRKDISAKIAQDEGRT